MLKHFTQHEDTTQDNWKDIKMTEFSAEFSHTQSSVFIRLFKRTDHFHYNNNLSCVLITAECFHDSAIKAYNRIATRFLLTDGVVIP